MISEQEVYDFLKGKDKNYLNSLWSRLHSNSTDNEPKHKIICCPKCGSVQYKLSGHYGDIQRYICKDCNKSFSNQTGSFFCHSRIAKDLWIKYIDFELARNTIEDIAYFLNLSKTTVYYMRHKLYKAVSTVINEQILTEEVKIDAKYTKINLKGNKPENMPRISKKRGNHAAYSGISHHKVCIIYAIDSWDNMIMNITGLGPESFDKYSQNSSYFKNVETL